MAYLDRTRSPHRAAIIAATLDIEALAILAVVKGLDVPFFPRSDEPPLIADNIPLTPPPRPPEAVPKPDRHPELTHDRQVTPRPFDFDGRTVPALPDPLPLPGPSAGPSPMPSADPVPPTPRAAPRIAQPVGSPAGWVSTNDYPARDLREGNHGTTGFELTIGTDGRVVSCMVTGSSGYPGLDRATCDALTRRARFRPATDDTGAKVTGTYANAIRWVIPE